MEIPCGRHQLYRHLGAVGWLAVQGQSTGYIFQNCKKLTSHVADEVLQKANNVKAARRATKPMRQPSFVSDVVKFNAAECIDKIEDYDAHPLLLNTPGGVVDLKSGEMAPHDRRPYNRCSTWKPSAARVGERWP